MSYCTFDFDMVNRDTLHVPDESRLVHILTGNPCDSVYCFVPRDIDKEELEDKLRLTLRKKYEKGPFGPSYHGYEDVSDRLEEIAD